MPATAWQGDTSLRAEAWPRTVQHPGSNTAWHTRHTHTPNSRDRIKYSPHQTGRQRLGPDPGVPALSAPALAGHLPLRTCFHLSDGDGTSPTPQPVLAEMTSGLRKLLIKPAAAHGRGRRDLAVLVLPQGTGPQPRPPGAPWARAHAGCPARQWCHNKQDTCGPLAELTLGE